MLLYNCIFLFAAIGVHPSNLNLIQSQPNITYHDDVGNNDMNIINNFNIEAPDSFTNGLFFPYFFLGLVGCLM